MTDEMFTDLHAEVLAFPRRYRSEAYPPELRRRLEAACAELVEGGMSWREAAKVLGVRSETLARWASRPLAVEPPATFLPVRVVERVRPCAGEVAVVSPSGWRVERLVLRDAVELLRTFG